MISSFFHPGTSYSKNDKRRLLYEIFFCIHRLFGLRCSGKLSGKIEQNKTYGKKKDKSE